MKHVLHGKSKSPEYGIWESMKQRCLNPNHKHYNYYGGRGISICEDWKSFDKFYNDMGDRPKGFTLDRIDPNVGYSKSNCRWVSWSIQSRNKSPQSRNKLGIIGVNIVPSGNYVSSIVVNKKKIYLGTFTNLVDAAQARKIAEEFYFKEC